MYKHVAAMTGVHLFRIKQRDAFYNIKSVSLISRFNRYMRSNEISLCSVADNM